jgi:hypothetical protein
VIVVAFLRAMELSRRQDRGPFDPSWAVDATARIRPRSPAIMAVFLAVILAVILAAILASILPS